MTQRLDVDRRRGSGPRFRLDEGQAFRWLARSAAAEASQDREPGGEELPGVDADWEPHAYGGGGEASGLVYLARVAGIISGPDGFDIALDYADDEDGGAYRVIVTVGSGVPQLATPARDWRRGPAYGTRGIEAALAILREVTDDANELLGGLDDWIRMAGRPLDPRREASLAASAAMTARPLAGAAGGTQAGPCLTCGDASASDGGESLCFPCGDEQELAASRDALDAIGAVADAALPAGQALESIRAILRDEAAAGTAAAEVWVLRHHDPHFDLVSVHASRAHALSDLASSVRSSWDNITDVPGVPATPDGLSDHKTVGIYFAQRAGIESYSLYSEEPGGAAAPDLPYGLARPVIRDLIALAAITAGAHERQPDTGPTAYLRALSELNQGWRDGQDFHRLALGVLPAVHAGGG